MPECELCGRVWDRLDPGVRYVPGHGVWLCADELSCFARVAEESGWCGKPGPDGLTCQRPAHDDDEHAAVKTWKG